ncbi:MAG TPA: hypothetical protein VIK89_03895, partial [Cytophagaceae bacterium]
MKWLGKKKFEKLEKKLQQSYAKDSILPGYDYVFALTYSDTSFYRYNIDSAYTFVLNAIANYEKTDSSVKVKRLVKSGINKDTILIYKLYLDSLAYIIASEKHTVEDYNHYLNYYPTSKFREISSRKRNELAFEAALEENSYQGYKYFIETYPEAEQIKQAKEIYHFLLYENKTNDKKLTSYYDFIHQHPESPYIHEAVKNIYEITTATNTVDAYLEFIRQFPQSPFCKKAADFLYYIPGDHWKHISYADSLNKVWESAQLELIPVYTNEVFRFVDSTGKIAISQSYKNLGEEYKCRVSNQDFLIVIPENEPLMITKDGQPIMAFPYEDVEELGMGLLRVTLEDYVGVVHKAGYRLTEIIYDEVELFNDFLIKIEKNGKAGLVTFTGRVVLAPVYDDITWEDPFIVVTNEEKVAITTFAQLSPILENTPIELQFRYDEAEKVSETFIIGYNEDNESLLDSSLKEIIPLAAHTIYYLKKGFLVKSEEQYHLLNDKGLPDDTTSYEDATFNQNWVGLKNDYGWKLKDVSHKDIFEKVADSIKIISDNYALAYFADSLALVNKDHKTLRFPKDSRIRLLKAARENSGQELVMVKTTKEKWEILNLQGAIIYSGKLDDAYIPCEPFLVIEQSRKKSIYDMNGNRIASGVYDGIGNCDQGNLSTLRSGKFGLINIDEGVRLEAESEETILPFASGIYKVKKQNGYILTDKGGKAIIPAYSDDILPFSDSLFLLQKNQEWSLMQIRNNENKLSGIMSQQIVDSGNEKFLIYADTSGKVGIYSSLKGVLQSPSYDEVVFIGTRKTPVFLARLKSETEDVISYYYINKYGRIIFEGRTQKEEMDDIM